MTRPAPGRTFALRLIALLWISLGIGFRLVPGRPDAWPVIAPVRPHP